MIPSGFLAQGDMVEEPVEAEVDCHRPDCASKPPEPGPADKKREGDQPDKQIHMGNRLKCLEARKRSGLGAIKRADIQNQSADAQNTRQMRGVDGVFSQPGGKDEQTQGHNTASTHGDETGKPNDASGALGIALAELGDVFRGGQTHAEPGENAEHADGGLDHPQLAIDCFTQHPGHQYCGAEHHAARDDRSGHGPEHASCQPVADRRILDSVECRYQARRATG